MHGRPWGICQGRWQKILILILKNVLILFNGITISYEVITIIYPDKSHEGHRLYLPLLHPGDNVKRGVNFLNNNVLKI